MLLFDVVQNTSKTEGKLTPFLKVACKGYEGDEVIFVRLLL